MGCKELIDALHREGAEKLSLIRQEAEAESVRIREDARSRAGEMRKTFDSLLADSAAEQAKTILREADREARMTMLRAEKELSDRIFGIAVSTLPLLRKGEYADVFRTLVSEIPSCSWETVRVGPEDVLTAGRHFPGASVIPDPAITGGLDVMTGDGRVRVINTFEKRMENAWPEILPEVIREAYEECRE